MSSSSFSALIRQSFFLNFFLVTSLLVRIHTVLYTRFVFLVFLGRFFVFWLFPISFSYLWTVLFAFSVSFVPCGTCLVKGCKETISKNLDRKQESGWKQKNVKNTRNEENARKRLHPSTPSHPQNVLYVGRIFYTTAGECGSKRTLGLIHLKEDGSWDCFALLFRRRWFLRAFFACRLF